MAYPMAYPISFRPLTLQLVLSINLFNEYPDPECKPILICICVYAYNISFKRSMTIASIGSEPKLHAVVVNRVAVPMLGVCQCTAVKEGSKQP